MQAPSRHYGHRHDNYYTLLQPEVYQMIQAIKRHGSGVRFFSDENALLEMTEGFSDLRRRLRQSKIEGADPLAINECLHPFVDLLRSTETNGAIIACCLSSVAKLVREEFFEAFEEETAVRGLRQLVVAVAKCRFEGGDAMGDEIALQRLLDFLILAMRHPLSKNFGDQDVCTILDTCYTMCVLPRVGELFKRQAELACIQISGIILDRVREPPFVSSEWLPPTAPPFKIAYPGMRGSDSAEAPLPPALAAFEAELAAVSMGEDAASTASPASAASPKPHSSHEAATDQTSAKGNFEARSSTPTNHLPDSAAPYSMLTVRELLNYMLSLLDVNEPRNTDRMRSLCLLVLSDFIERNPVRVLATEPIWALLSQKFSRVLIQLVALESPALSVHLHQTVFSVYRRFRRRLVAQSELLLTTVLRLATQKHLQGKSPKIPKEFYLELLLTLCLHKQCLTDLYVLYECGPRFGFVFSDLVAALVASTLPDSKALATVGQDASHALALEMILLMLEALDVQSAPSSGAVRHPEADALQKTKMLKSLHSESARLFNKDPKDAFAFLAEHGLTSDPATPKEKAQYLRRTAGLEKKTVGEILSKPSNIEILEEFLADYQFSGLEIDEALRLVLESFRLPGEAQQISRIMEAFAKVYFDANRHRNVFANEDAVFVLAYSIVMLNTDQHNKQVRHRMNPQDFIRNNRGINDGQSFEEAFLRRIFEAISEKEIVMPEEQAGETAFNYVWNEQLKKYSDHDEPPHYEFHVYAQDILLLIWKPILTCFRALVMFPQSDTATRMVIQGINRMGRLANGYLQSAQMDSLIGVLVECMAFKEVMNGPGGNQLARYLAKSDLFQVIVKSFFDQFRLHGNSIREGWKQFVYHLMILAQSSIVKFSMLEADQGDDAPPSQTVDSPRVRTQKNESGILSTLSQYLVSSSTPSVPSSSEQEVRMRAIDLVKSCKLDEIVRDSRFLKEDTLQVLMSAMMENLNITKPATWKTETLVFLVDLVVHMAWNNRDRMSSFWTRLFNLFSDLAKDLAVPAAVREHAILGLGRLSLRLADRPEMQKEIVQFFQLLCYVPPDSFQKLAEPALSIVLRIVELDPPILHGTAIWPHYFTVLGLAGRSKSCGPYSFGLLTTIVREDELLFPIEFYSEYVDLLNGFIAFSTSTQSPIHSHSSSGDSLPLPVELAGSALQKFSELEASIVRLVAEGSIPATEVWHHYFIPIHCAVAQQCYHPVREIRQQALSLLQRIILSIDFGAQGRVALYEEFELVLIPLLVELQQPEMSRLDGGAGNVEEIQVRAAAVVSRVFLSNMSLLFDPVQGSSVESERLWSVLITHLLRFLEGKSDVLRESIPETIKNMLLVLAASGILHAPSPEQEGSLPMWDITWRLLDPVMLRARTDIFEIATPRTLSPNASVEKVPELPVGDEPSTEKQAAEDAENPSSAEACSAANTGPSRPTARSASRSQPDLALEFESLPAGRARQSSVDLHSHSDPLGQSQSHSQSPPSSQTVHV